MTRREGDGKIPEPTLPDLTWAGADPTTRRVPDPTRREADPTRREADPTRREADPTRPMPADPTRREADPTRPMPAEQDADAGGLPPEVFARYEPVRSLGAGGEAHVVMLVRDRRTGEHRVVKVYGVQIRPDRELFDALRTADARQVVRVLESGEYTDAYARTVCWEVMEYVAGGSLAELIAEHAGPLDAARVRTIMVEIADALRYMHTSLRVGGGTGWTHRDIKPGNVLVRSRQPLDLVLCDFGLVAAIRATRRTGRAGTPLYQAPETWWRNSHEPPQDWWALGIIVVEMLTGRHPNRGPAHEIPEAHVLFEHLATHDVDLSGVTDPRWELLCRGLLTRAPEHRWGAAQVASWLAGGSPPVQAGGATIMPSGTPAPAASPAPPART
ncbi:MAG: serine/threonine-protein kinase, partial [Dactylosporangium sp.]|nr:serine/threonine-protein kinase [Dactylosporangium sp.]